MTTRHVFAGLTVLVLLGWAGVSGSTLGLTQAAAPAAPSGVCPLVQNTPFFTIVYGTVTLDGVNAPVGAAVEARSPREDTVGCFVVSQPGNYGAMYVYGEDTSVSPPIPGMRTGEVIGFYVDSNLATATPQLAWSNDKELHQIDLSANSAPPLPDLIVQNVVAVPSTPLQGQLVAVTVTILNQGTAAATRRFDTDAYDDHVPTGCNDYGWDYKTTNSLGVGEMISLTFTHRGFATTGAHSFYAQVDSGCVVTESIESNNIYGPLQVQVIPPVLPPAADFTASPTSGFAPLTVKFTDQSTGSITNWSWSFGDGGNDSNVNPIHTYDQPGIYTVTLTVTGPAGSNTLTRTNYITVTELPPVAGFTANPTSGLCPLTVAFTDTSTGIVISWTWTFGDSNITAQQNPTHTYTTSGAYTASLSVSGPNGADTLTRTNYITVYEPVVADFIAYPTSGVAPLTVVFTNTSTGDYTDSLWNFGDGMTSTLEHPTHVYTSGGRYTITLTASGPGGIDTLGRTNHIAANGPLASIILTPNPATVTVGATLVFTVSGLDANGNVVPITPMWTTDAGTMTGNLLTAQTTPANGKHVTATVGSVSGIAAVEVVVGTLASVAVTPNLVTITVGMTQTFFADGADAFGNAMYINPTWTTDAGTMTSHILTAQTIPVSSKRVTATVGSVHGTGVVNVSTGPLSHLEITPTIVTLAMHESCQFSAIGFDAYSNSVTGLSWSWQVTQPDAGAIDAAGLFTAGIKAGAYPNVVVVSLVTISSAADVIVHWPYQTYLPVVLR